MQVQRIQSNNNYNTNFKEKLKFDTKLISRATREEKSELALLKRLFKNYGFDGEIKVKNDKNVSIKDVIENLRSKFSEIEFEQKKLRKIQDGLG